MFYFTIGEIFTPKTVFVWFFKVRAQVSQSHDSISTACIACTQLYRGASILLSDSLTFDFIICWTHLPFFLIECSQGQKKVFFDGKLRHNIDPSIFVNAWVLQIDPSFCIFTGLALATGAQQPRGATQHSIDRPVQFSLGIDDDQITAHFQSHSLKL